VFSQRTGALFLVSAVLFGGTFIAAKAGLAYFPPLFFVRSLRHRSGRPGGVRSDQPFSVGVTPADRRRHHRHPRNGRARHRANERAVVRRSTGRDQRRGRGRLQPEPDSDAGVRRRLAFGDRLSVRGSAGMVLGLLGVGLVANPDSTALLGGGIGIPLLFGAAVTSALGAVVIRRAESTTMSSTARTVWGVPLAAVLSHGLSLSAGESVTGLWWCPQSRSQRCSTSASFRERSRISLTLRSSTRQMRRKRISCFTSSRSSRRSGLGPAWRDAVARLTGRVGVIFVGFLLVSGLPTGVSGSTQACRRRSVRRQ